MQIHDQVTSKHNVVPFYVNFYVYKQLDLVSGEWSLEVVSCTATCGYLNGF